MNNELNKKTPISHAIKAKPHSPVYRMHRYFARRPHNVFAELIQHYSKPMDIVLDPFCGGGVTLVEGLLQGRRVVGCDQNRMATFITEMELRDLNVKGFQEAVEGVLQSFKPTSNRLFTTQCRGCGSNAKVLWFEYSGVTDCSQCGHNFSIAEAKKSGPATWNCLKCGNPTKFVSTATASFKIQNIHYSCNKCKQNTTCPPEPFDFRLLVKVKKELATREKNGLWLPNENIPDCNMQRESSLFKKGIVKFRQLFTDRHLLALGLLKEAILAQESKYQPWLLFSFSSSLRYTNRMVTRNPEWRGDRPLEWAKPGFWLPAVHLEANIAEEFAFRCQAVVRGKTDFRGRANGVAFTEYARMKEVTKSTTPFFSVNTGSSSKLPLDAKSIDVIITDPPYGSYVHYADLCNFWAVWLPEIKGLGRLIDTTEEAVIARKKFPGAKDAKDYQRILEACFCECSRVLKDDSFMVMTFNNREPRAWASLMIAAAKAGFSLAPNGILFQDGVDSYKHTAQSRRNGSVIGDFILSFKKTKLRRKRKAFVSDSENTSDLILKIIKELLKLGPLTPNDLMSQLYIQLFPWFVSQIENASENGNKSLNELLENMNEIQFLDSHRKELLQRHFLFSNGRWSLPK
jgi:putative DNA methylase